jgi:hypothetical protein
MKQYIIDANNLMHKIKVTRDALSRSLQISQNLLIEIFKNYASKHRSCQFSLVFDGKIEAYTSPPERIKLLESGNVTADEIIKSLIKEIRIPHECTVISSDTSVYNFARIHGVVAQKSEDFVSLLASVERTESSRMGTYKKEQEKPTHTSKKDLIYFRSVFGKSDDTAD